MNYDEGEIKNIHYGDILVKFDSIIDINNPEVPFITGGKAEDYYKSQLLKNGDIIIADTAEDETTGKAVEITGISDNYVVSGLHTMVARPNETFAQGYLGYYLNSQAYRNQLLPLMQGIKVLSLSKTNMAKTIVAFPKDATEQTAIGKFFRTLDDLLTLHKRKLEGLKELKRGYLQQMFPQKGERIPRVRFDGFVGDWEERKFGEVLAVNSGRDYKHLNSGNIPVYGTGGYMLSVNESISKVDAIGIGRKGTIDKPQLLSAPFWTVDTLFFMTPISNYNLLYMYALSQNIEWAKMDESTGVPSLSKINIENIDISMPNSIEQAAIGNFFRNLDSLISAQNKKLNQLKELKSAYLQKMFI